MKQDSSKLALYEGEKESLFSSSFRPQVNNVAAILKKKKKETFHQPRSHALSLSFSFSLQFPPPL